jgi:hypothetical protein
MMAFGSRPRNGRARRTHRSSRRAFNDGGSVRGNHRGRSRPGWMTESSRVAEGEDHSCSGGAVRPLGGARCAPGHHGNQRACDLVSRQTSMGHLGHQCSQAPGRPILLSFSPSPRREADYVNPGSSSSAERSLGGCRKDLPRLEVAPMGEISPACIKRPGRAPSSGFRWGQAAS